MDIELLRTFLEVKRTRHFGRASENLFLTQAAVSSRIRQLESILGVPLFTRNRNNIQLTLAGEELTDHAETILHTWATAKSNIQRLEHSPTQLCIGTTPNIWDLILHNQIAGIFKNIPDVTLRTEVQNSEFLARMLIERDMDLSLVYDPPKLEELTATPLFKLKLVLLCSKKVGEDLEEAFETGYVKVHWGASVCIGKQLNQESNRSSPSNTPKKEPSPILQTSHCSLAIQHLLTHGGCCYLPETAINYRSDEHKLEEDTLNKTERGKERTNYKSLYKVENQPSITTEIFAVARKDHPQQPLLEQIIEHLRRQTTRY